MAGLQWQVTCKRMAVQCKLQRSTMQFKHHLAVLMLCALCLQDSGQPGGMAGLQNLGNSCYLNAAVQCLAHTGLFRTMFLTTAYQADISEKNPDGRKGNVVRAFGDVVQALWQVHHFDLYTPSSLYQQQQQQTGQNDNDDNNHRSKHNNGNDKENSNDDKNKQE